MEKTQFSIDNLKNPVSHRKIQFFDRNIGFPESKHQVYQLNLKNWVFRLKNSVFFFFFFFCQETRRVFSIEKPGFSIEKPFFRQKTRIFDRETGYFDRKTQFFNFMVEKQSFLPKSNFFDRETRYFNRKTCMVFRLKIWVFSKTCHMAGRFNVQ